MSAPAASAAPKASRHWLATERVDVLDRRHPPLRPPHLRQRRPSRRGRRGTPLLALSRPPWKPEPGDRWTRVSDMASAARPSARTRARVFLAVGRQEIAAFRAAPQHRYLVRSIEPPAPGRPPRRQPPLRPRPLHRGGRRAPPPRPRASR